MEHIKPQAGGRHGAAPGQGYEKTDVEVRGVFAFLAVLAFSAVLINLWTYGFYRLLDHLAVQRDNSYMMESGKGMVRPRQLAAGSGAETPSMRSETTEQTAERLVATFPAPRLQTDDVYDLHVLRGKEDLYLNHYTWVDKNAGTVRIPIERAMELIAQRGLPAMNTPQPPLSPTAGQQPQQSMPNGGPGNH